MEAKLKAMDEGTDVTVTGTPLSFENSKATYAASEIDSGNYVLVFTLWGDSEKTLKIGEWREYAGICGNMREYAGITDGLESSSSPAIETNAELDGIYTLKLNLNGGTFSGTVPGSFTRFSNAITLPTAANFAKTGFSFDGWFDNEGLTGSAVTTVAAGTSVSKEFWAKWTAYPTATITATPTVTTGDITAGSTTALVSAGTIEGGSLMYAVTTENTKPTSTEGFSATVPTAENRAAGTYYVWYYVKADDAHTDSEISAAAIAVTVQDNPKAVPLTLEALTDGTIVVKKPKSGMQYSKNGGAGTKRGDGTVGAGGTAVAGTVTDNRN